MDFGEFGAGFCLGIFVLAILLIFIHPTENGENNIKKQAIVEGHAEWVATDKGEPEFHWNDYCGRKIER